MSLKTTFTYVVIPEINKNFSEVTWLFRSQYSNCIVFSVTIHMINMELVLANL